ncbi:hypothetical protein Aduo_019676 [Ancylostoma duodenale]
MKSDTKATPSLLLFIISVATTDADDATTDARSVPLEMPPEYALPEYFVAEIVVTWDVTKDLSKYRIEPRHICAAVCPYSLKEESF